ncbi:MAG: hypothetical protein QM691_04875 [Opitutaceae bacterium]
MNDELPLPPRSRLARPSPGLHRRMDDLFATAASARPTLRLRLLRRTAIALPIGLAAALLLFFARRPPQASPEYQTPALVVTLSDELCGELIPPSAPTFQYDLSIGSF